MPRARRAWRRTTFNDGRREGDDWGDNRASESTEDDLPDWQDTSESHVEDLRQQLLVQPRTQCNVMHIPAVLRGCRFLPFASLGLNLRQLILSKLNQLGDSLSYIEEAVDNPDRLHVLLWLPKPQALPTATTTAAPTHDLQHDPARSNCVARRCELSLLLSTVELHRTRLTRHTSSPRTTSAPGRNGPGPGPGQCGPGPDADPHLLGFCILGRCGARRTSGSGSGPCMGLGSDSGSSRYNTIEYFCTLVNGYNFGELMFQRAGQLCLRRLRSQGGAGAGAGTAGASAGATVEAAGEAGPSGAGGEPLPSVTGWPLPSAPKNIFYWIKLERLPELGRGGMLRAFAETWLGAEAEAAPARHANGASGGGGGRRSAWRARGSRGQRRRDGGRGPARLEAETGGGTVGEADAEAAAGVAGSEVAVASGTGAETDVGGVLAAFRRFCVDRLRWELVEVEAYLEAVGGEKEVAAVLAAAAAAAVAAAASTAASATAAIVTAAAATAAGAAGVGGSAAGAVGGVGAAEQAVIAAVGTVSAPRPQRQLRRAQQTQAPPLRQRRQSQLTRVPIAFAAPAPAADRGRPTAAEGSVGCYCCCCCYCFGGGSAAARPGRAFSLWRPRFLDSGWASASDCCASGTPLLTPLPLPAAHQVRGRSGRGSALCALAPTGAAPGLAAGSLRRVRPGVTHGSLLGRAAASGGTASRRRAL